MSEPRKDRSQPDRGITRRDFLDGVAISAAGLAAAAAAPNLTGAEAALAGHSGRLPRGYYPPTSTGITGEPDRPIADVLSIDGPPNPEHVHSTDGGPGIRPASVHDVDGDYDLLVVGAGASGLAAAKWYQDRFGADSRILIVDPLPDFGGHSHRNEFHIPDASNGGADVMLLRNGGTVNLDSVGAWNKPQGGVPPSIPGSYGQPALDMLAFCGVDPNNFPNSRGPGIPASLGLRQVLLFPAADWGRDYVVAAKQSGESWPTFLARTPYSPEAQSGIARIMTDDSTDWIALKDGPKSDQEKKAILARITYKRYLMDYVGVTEEATGYLQRTSHGLFGAGIQAVQAGDTWALGNPGFDGLVLNNDPFPGIGRTAQQDMMPNAEPTVAWPDGNSSLLRLLVSKLIPEVFADVNGARPTQDTVLIAQADYTQLDRRRNAVRIRLNHTVVDVVAAHGRNRLAEITYVPTGSDGRKGERVRARHVVMACWNRVTARLVRGLPRRQVEALDYARKVPLIYCRVGVRNWHAFADAKISSVSPRGNSLFFDNTTLSAGAEFGSSYGPTPNNPDQPATLALTCTPDDPTVLTQLESYERGREKMLQMTFDDYERIIVDVIDRTVNRSGGDFEPERDIESIMLNRWNYGYAYELCSTFDPSLFGPVSGQPQVRGRQPFANVAIANSDSGAFAYTHSAINEAHRAVQDLPSR
jgi:spermidine dehydrogenase